MILFLVAFLLVFPKGGVKIAEVPVTWGYLGLAAACLWLPVALWMRHSARVRTIRLLVLAALVPFQLTIWGALLVNGTNGLGFAISLFVTFFFIPGAFVLVLGVHLDRLHLGFLLRLVRYGVLAVAVYGIVLFVYKLKTGEFIEIPYLTINAGDAGGLESKYIDRGGVFKLISTYNNGNIYGVSILTLLPLYTWLERSTTRVMIVKLSLILTLSRTVWIGLVFYEVLQRAYVRRLSVRSAATLVAALALIAAGVWYALVEILGMKTSFLFDRRLGGRIGQLDALQTATLLPETRFEAILEMVYLSVLQNFGVLGLAAFVLGVSAPLLAFFARVVPFGATPFKKSLAAGLMVYLLVAVSDGAILFIPVMAFYWFVASLLLSDNPSFDDCSAAPAPPGGGASPREPAMGHAAG